MPTITTTGYENRIRAEFPDLSRSQVKRAAKRIAWRAVNMQTELDFYAELRILGILHDPTPRAAILGR